MIDFLQCYLDDDYEIITDKKVNLESLSGPAVSTSNESLNELKNMQMRQIKPGTGKLLNNHFSNNIKNYFKYENTYINIVTPFVLILFFSRVFTLWQLFFICSCLRYSNV